MRFLSFLLLCCVIPALAMAQAPAEKYPYQQYPTPPPFKLTLPDGKMATANELGKNKEKIVLIFSVDCDHCKHLTQDVLKNISKFKDKQILMITPFGRERMVEYYKQYKIANYPGITMASEPTRQIMNFYGLQQFPGVYFYGKKGNLINKHFEGDVKASDLL
ncbi:redoxin domain-containing protein [Chitinophaga horti]|uniref:Redoxin domain-containing protein n=1 Tax=Chitinophaga horti TaxID=2920382 RepID=A0ABY6J223_9BACT|nr:redoxin domain-containing protein [Chitinophaga horti]UYQ93724.1 redoxin domain-containing protein [Chitinophaga horti]